VRERKQREHKLDRMIAAATYRAEQARRGNGHRFELPPSLRRLKRCDAGGGSSTAGGSIPSTVDA
jgi:hypothetical protein